MRHEFDGYDILQGISAVVNETDRIAVVGPNGAGKTTLMKIITGEMKATEGSIENAGNIGLGYLSQIHFDSESRSVFEELRLAFSDLLSLEAEIAEAELHLETSEEIEHYTTLLETFRMRSGFDYAREIDRVAR